jgi:hypothetical protein
MPSRFTPTVSQLPPLARPGGRRSSKARIRLAAAAALAGAAIVAVPAAADASSTCSLDVLGQLTVKDGSGSAPLRIVRSGQFIGLDDGSGALTFCAGANTFANVTNTTLIVVRGTASSGGGGLIVDNSNGALGPGEVVESDGNSEIEVLVDPTNLNTPTLAVKGTQGADSIKIAAGGGVMMGNDGDVDIRARGAGLISVSGLGGSDFITGRGSFPSTAQPPADRPIHLFGGSGSDTLVDGIRADHLFGDGGNDTLFTVDNDIDRHAGGADFDKATVDTLDVPLDGSTEQVTKTGVGTLRLAPAVVSAKAGGVARMTMSWTHPKAWKALRSIDWRVMKEDQRVADITVRPTSGRLSAHGAAELATGSRVTHKGKTVTARLSMRLPQALAGEHLRVDVEATDGNGHHQLEPSAGLINVAK